MAFKSTLLMLAFFPLFARNVYCDNEELVMKVEDAKTPVPAVAPVAAPPLKPPTPPAVRPPTPPAQPPVVSPAPVKPPAVSPAPVKPPVVSPVPVKPPVASPPTAPIVKSLKDCAPLCENRCQLHSRKRVCMRACGTCCERCKCVPPGTAGNRELCGKCYTDMITHGNRSKCP